MLDSRFIGLSLAELKNEIEVLPAQRDTEEATIMAVWKLLQSGGGSGGITPQGDFDDDADAAANGVAIGQFYTAKLGNFMGLPDGTLKKRTS